MCVRVRVCVFAHAAASVSHLAMPSVVIDGLIQGMNGCTYFCCGGVCLTDVQYLLLHSIQRGRGEDVGLQFHRRGRS